MIGWQGSEDPEKEDPKKEDPKKEDPKKEDPKKEDPKKEDPKKDLIALFNECVEEQVARALQIAWNEAMVSFAASGNVHGVVFCLGKGATTAELAREAAVMNHQLQVVALFTAMAGKTE